MLLSSSSSSSSLAWASGEAGRRRPPHTSTSAVVLGGNGNGRAAEAAGGAACASTAVDKRGSGRKDGGAASARREAGVVAARDRRVDVVRLLGGGLPATLAPPPPRPHPSCGAFVSVSSLLWRGDAEEGVGAVGVVPRPSPFLSLVPLSFSFPACQESFVHATAAATVAGQRCVASPSPLSWSLDASSVIGRARCDGGGEASCFSAWRRFPV